MNYKSFIKDVENWAVRKALPYAVAGALLFGTHTALPNGYHIKPKTETKVAQKAPEYRGKIAFVSDRDGKLEIYTMNADGSNQRRLTKKSGCVEDSGPVWSPDGKFIAFPAWNDSNIEIYTMNADGSNLRNITNNPANDKEPVWSPDGKRIAFDSNRDDNEEIYVMNNDGTNPRNITKSQENEHTPGWARGGKSLVFLRDYVEFPPGYDDKNSDAAAFSSRYTDSMLYVINLDGTNLRNLSGEESKVSSYDILPDGRVVAFDRDGISLNVVDIEMGRERKIIKEYTEFYPGDEELYGNNSIGNDIKWSPDGKRIAFVAGGDEGIALYTVSSDGKNVRKVTDHSLVNISWSPDGKRIVFGDYREISLINVTSRKKIRLIKLRGEHYPLPAWQPVPKESKSVSK